MVWGSKRRAVGGGKLGVVMTTIGPIQLGHGKNNRQGYRPWKNVMDQSVKRDKERVVYSSV